MEIKVNKCSIELFINVIGEKAENKKLSGSKSTTMRNLQDEIEEEWVLQEPLPKEKSKFRISLG
ncbi:hypothetical protein [Photorhabdus heterorhabditis]|uniref:hypothetical protein n=1 Tax=Photorhabdus heterorhabditis TaxID=880156 RepID=UPI001BD33915|nr:hypothetical protein [Photorhabdus heterorhabditis]